MYKTTVKIATSEAEKEQFYRLRYKVYVDEMGCRCRYLDLLKMIPEITIKPVGGETDCCEMGGNFGFKVDFHEKTLAIGRHLMEKIRGKAPQAIITDCMSCRLQFLHSLPYPVFHPMEVLARAYSG
ncbi:MAG: heterodisulfide reductase-related iron-sulfur binding cluster [Desulfuromonadales bacterium]